MSDGDVPYLLKMPRELKAELEEEASRQGRSLKDYIIEILRKRNRVNHVDIDKLLKARWVVKPAPIDVYCASCGKLIPKGTDTVWVVGTRINICLECMRKTIEKAPIEAKYWEKALNAYRKYIEYSNMAKYAKKELDEIVYQLNEAEAVKKVMDIVRKADAELGELAQLRMNIINTVGQQSPQLEAVAGMIKSLESLKNELRKAVAVLATVKIKQRRKPKEVARP